MVRVVFSHLKTLDPSASSSVPPPSLPVVDTATAVAAPSDQVSTSTTAVESEGIAPIAIAPMDPTALPLAAFEPKTPTNEVPPALNNDEGELPLHASATTYVFNFPPLS